MDIDLEKLINGVYEMERLPTDFSSERAVPDFAYNVLTPLGLLYRPVVDERSLTAGREKPRWPGNRSFAVCLTHDVDVVSSRSIREVFRREIGAWPDQRAPNRFSKCLTSPLKALALAAVPIRHDPLHQFEQWLALEEEVGARSTFFFWPGVSSLTRRHFSDCLYELSDTLMFDGQRISVQELMREISRRGWEIGLHPSWYSYDDVSEMKRQKEALEEGLGDRVVSVRQHLLHYDIRVTPRVHSEAGFLYDSTLGFNDNVGFRFGTCHPWRLSDLRAGRKLPVVEMPLIVQDVAMLNPRKGLRLDAETAFGYVKFLTESVENVGGLLTLLWHPNNTHGVSPSWWNLYARCLHYFKEKKAWFATMKEAGDWWTRTR